MINEKELNSMLYLLDDEDDRIVEHIESKICSMGPSVIPFLEKKWPDEDNAKRQERIVSLIKTIKQKALAFELNEWRQTTDQDLLDGLLIINKIHDPTVNKQLINNLLDKIKLDAWLELNYDLTSFEKVKILNHIMFDVHGYTGDTDDYHHSKNSYLSEVLDSKKGNPISLAVIYSIVAQRLNIPIYGVKY